MSINRIKILIMLDYVMIRDSINVSIVKSLFLQHITFIDIWEFTMGRDHINVPNAPCLSENRIPYKIMLEVTRGRKGTLAMIVPKSFLDPTPLKTIWGVILERNRTVVHLVQKILKSIQYEAAYDKSHGKSHLVVCLVLLPFPDQTIFSAILYLTDEVQKSEFVLNCFAEFQNLSKCAGQ